MTIGIERSLRAAQRDGTDYSIDAARNVNVMRLP
ncbi:hypothetical protein FHT70_000396 [Rhizobium sp. BK049]|nr:hypothetical protein [Rhizobium sp. BK049]